MMGFCSFRRHVFSPLNLLHVHHTVANISLYFRYEGYEKNITIT